MESDRIESWAEEVRTLLRERLRLKGRDLDAQLARARGRLPRRLRREGAYLAEAERMAGHPKLARRIDMPRAEKAHRRLADHLGAIDPKERRITLLLNVLALAGLVLLAVGAGVVWWLWRTGRV